MTLPTRLKPALLVLAATGVMTAIFAAGLGAGLYVYPRTMADHDAHDDHGDHHEEDDHAPDDHTHPHDAESGEEDHVALTPQAVANLGLRLGAITQGDYWKSMLVPAEVVEIPGRSDLSVSAPVSGIIEDVRVVPGESICTKQPLFVIRITDEALTDAQSQLLSALAREDVVRQEIERLAPIIQSGAVPGKRTRDYEYELQQLAAQKETLVQQLRGRGLPEPVLQSVITGRKLATTLEIGSPSFVQDGPWKEGETPGTANSDPKGYSIETMKVHPGKSVQRGDDLCSLAYHAELYIEGTAFESDLEVLQRIAENGWPIDVELHQANDHPAGPDGRHKLRLLRVDNHVDEESQTVRFYVTLPNEVERSVCDDLGRHFVQWRFRPGQRLHLRLPVEKWQNQITLPSDAVVIEGPNAIVFAEHHHEPDDHHAEDDDADHHELDDHDELTELEPVPVRLLHRDERTVVLSRDIGIDPDVKIALNHAYKLHLEMKTQSAGGGGHHHHHDH